jgi:hypothetical protein
MIEHIEDVELNVVVNGFVYVLRRVTFCLKYN